jgi:hypothetical protein
MRVIIDNTETHDLVDLMDGDGSTTDGEVYGIDGILLEPGDHSFYFEASDGDEDIRFPASSPLPGPHVLHVNVPPILEDGRVSPLSGNPDQIFQYRVTYIDEDNTPPAGGVRLFIDGGEIDERMILDLDADPQLRDGNMTNGEAYVFSTNLSLGTHDFTFNSTDGEAYVQIGPLSGPIVSLDPILIPIIDSPSEGDVYHMDENVSYSAHFESNVDVDDAVFVWSSNISGELGTGPEILRNMELGNHTITLNVSSQERIISSETTVNITVIESEPEHEVFIIFHRYPEAEYRVPEGDNTTFGVILNKEHPLVNTGVDVTYVWRLDDIHVDVQLGSMDYRPGYLDSGVHVLELTLYAGNIVEKARWNITVTDVPAPILIKDGLPDDLGRFRKRDILSVSLPLIDPEGRELTASWSVDGFPVPGSSLTLDLELRGGIWAHEGGHVLRAEITNPDGSLFVLNITYSIIEEEVDDDDGELDNDDDYEEEEDDDDEDDDGRLQIFKDDPVGALIIGIGAASVIAGVFYAGFVLIAPDRNRKSSSEVEWED